MSDDTEQDWDNLDEDEIRRRVDAIFANESLPPGINLQTATLREVLEAIAQANQGILVVKNAIRAMSRADLFGNPDHANSTVYCTILRAPNFHRVMPGVYEVGPRLTKWEMMRLMGRREEAEA